MRDAPAVLCLLGLTAVQLTCAWRRLHPPSALGAPIATREAWAAERVGEGLVCVTDRSFASTRMCRRAPCGSLSTERRLLLGAPLTPEHMSQRDWEALPGIGAKRARAIMEAHGPEVPAGALYRGRGMGTNDKARLVNTLGLDEKARLDICSLGSWPTTSSGYDRLR